MKSTARLLLTGLVFALLVLAGCQQQAEEVPTNDTSPIEDDQAEEPEAQEVSVSLTDDSLSLGEESLEEGLVRFEVSNDGDLYNEFAIEGNGEYHDVEGGISAGETMTLEAELSAGDYKAYSPIPGREERGVVAQFVVE